MEYIPHTRADIEQMLRAIGVGDVEDLFSDIPAEIRARYRPLGLSPRSELEVRRGLEGRAIKNRRLVPFLGLGLYDHYIPAVVNELSSRSEFYTAYTPYQAEVSQGTLTWMFEYQTMICELTGMEVANASMYDGGTALAEAVFMARRIVGGDKVLVPRSLNPLHREVVETYCRGAGIEVVDLPFDEVGRLVLEEVPEGVIALIVQQPNGLGIIEDLSGLKERLGDAFLIVSVYPIALGILEPPGSLGADIVVGEGQPLGNPLSFGGPLLGLFATRRKYLRMMPGRVSGRTVDVEGKEGYVMTLQTREQHIRRERATSNICTNSALCALRAAIYLAALGPEGLRQVALLCLERAHELAQEIERIPGFELAFKGPFFNEFAVRCSDPEGVTRDLREAGFAVVPPVYLERMGVERAFSLALTEKRTGEEIQGVLEVLREHAR